MKSELIFQIITINILVFWNLPCMIARFNGITIILSKKIVNNLSALRAHSPRVLGAQLSSLSAASTRDSVVTLCARCSMSFTYKL